MVLSLNTMQKRPVLAGANIPIAPPVVAVLSARDMAILAAARQRQVARR
jgi:hypothetical protein